MNQKVAKRLTLFVLLFEPTAPSASITAHPRKQMTQKLDSIFPPPKVTGKCEHKYLFLKPHKPKSPTYPRFLFRILFLKEFDLFFFFGPSAKNRTVRKCR